MQANGVYQFRLPHENYKNHGRCEWYWVNRSTGARESIRPILLESSATASGPYTADLSAAINPGAKTVSVARSGNARFYRLRSSTALTISSIAVQGSNVLLSYQ